MRGDFAGDSLLSDRSIHNLNVQALENSITARLSGNDFHDFLNKDQNLALKFPEFFSTISKGRSAQIAGERFVEQKNILSSLPTTT